MSQASATETPDALIGQRIKGRFRILRVHARGGMSLLYAASDKQGAGEVAVKVLDRARIDDSEAVARFLDEARVQSAVEHERVVAVLDYGRLPDGRPFLVMPLVAGEDVATLLRREGPQHPRRVAQLLADAAAALDTMHARGIVHRDIKSENLMLAKGPDGADAVLVLDFGVAAAALRNARAPVPDPTSGTPEFMPPEALAGEAYDRRGDIYALATVAFELITGRLPFVGSDPRALAEAKAQAAPKLSEVAQGEIPQALDAIVARGLAEDPSRRPRSAVQFVRDLAAAAQLVPRDHAPPSTDASTSSMPSDATSAVPGPRRSTRPGYARVLSQPPPAQSSPPAQPNKPAAATSSSVPAASKPETKSAKVASKTNGAAKRASIEPTPTSSAPKRASASVPVAAPPPIGSIAPPEAERPTDAADEAPSEVSAEVSNVDASAASSEATDTASNVEASAAASEVTDTASSEAAAEASSGEGVESPRAETTAQAVEPPTEPINVESNVAASVSVPLDDTVEDDLATLRPPRASVGWLSYVAVLAVAAAIALALFGRSSSTLEEDAQSEAALAPTAEPVAPVAAEPDLQPAPTEAAQPLAAQDEPPPEPAAAEPEPAATIEPAAIALGAAAAPPAAAVKPAPARKPKRAAKPRRRVAAKAPEVESPTSSRGEPAEDEPAKGNARERAKRLTDDGVEAMLGGRFDEAAKLFAKAVAIDGRYAPAWRSRGLVLERLGRKAQAANAFRRYLDLAPSGAAADAVRTRLDAL